MRVAVDGAIRPRPGDAVDIYVTFATDAVPADADPTLTVAAGVPVVSVDRGEGGDLGGPGAGDAGDVADAPSGSSRGPTVGVTVLVTEPEARRLAFATATGTLALAIVPPEDAAAGGAHT
jgi:Flp pilus assembly protein CpaB